MANENTTKIIERGHAHPLATSQRSGFLSPDEKSFLETIMDIGGIIEVAQEVREARGTKQDLKTRLLEIEQLAAGDVQFSTLETEFFTARAGQTLISLAGEYRTGSNQLDVYINGIKQHVDYSYVELDSKQIMMTEELSANSKIEVKYFKDVPAVTTNVAAQVYKNQAEIERARTTSLGVTYSSLRERLDALDLQSGDAIYDSFIADGTKTDFILANGSFSESVNNTEVYLNGLTLEPVYEFEILSSTTIRIKRGTTTGDRLVIKTQKTVPPIVEPPDFDRTYYSFKNVTAGTRLVNLPKAYKVGMKRLDVYRNGQFQTAGVDYLENDPTSIYFSAALAVNDAITVVIYAEGVVLNTDNNAQFDAVIAEVEEARFNAANVASPSLKSRLVTMESKIASDYTTAISSSRTSITSAYTSAIAAAVDTAKSDLTTAYVAADTASRTTVTTAYTNAIAASKTTITSEYNTAITTALATSKSTITSEYNTAITTAKSDLTTAYTAADTASRTTVTTAYTNAIAAEKTNITTAYTAAIAVVDGKVGGLNTRLTTVEGDIVNLKKSATELVASLPTASVTYRGQMKAVMESGDEVLYYCGQTDGAYVWKPVTLT